MGDTQEDEIRWEEVILPKTRPSYVFRHFTLERLEEDEWATCVLYDDDTLLLNIDSEANGVSIYRYMRKYLLGELHASEGNHKKSVAALQRLWRHWGMKEVQKIFPGILARHPTAAANFNDLDGYPIVWRGDDTYEIRWVLYGSPQEYPPYYTEEDISNVRSLYDDKPWQVTLSIAVLMALHHLKYHENNGYEY